MRTICIVLFVFCLATTRARAQDHASAEPTTTPVEPVAASVTAKPSAQAADANPAPSEPVLMSASELAALGLDSSEPTVDNSLRFGGFLDVGFGNTIASQDGFWRAGGTVPSHSTFFVGNFNLFVREDFNKFLRMMGEVRFTYLPNGSSVFGTQSRTDTAVSDYTDFGRSARWGSIIIERAYIELTPHPQLNIRVGQFLTPYGIWNVDHGSPVVIPVRRPWSVGIGWFPQRQTGIELFGRVDSHDWGVGYHVTLSNGTGPVSEYADLDENKAIGGRLFAEYQGFGKAKLGASAYYGRQTDSSHTMVGTSANSLRYREDIKSQFDMLSFAGDLSWDLGELHLQTEWIVSQQAYTAKGRAQTVAFAETTVIPSDVVSWGGYGLIGYRLPWLGIMPFVVSERAIGALGYSRVKLYSLQFGLNIRPFDMLVFKATFDHVVIQNDYVGPVSIIMTQLAVAY